MQRETTNPMPRRVFLGAAAAGVLTACATRGAHSAQAAFPVKAEVDFHVHLDKSTIDAVLALPAAQEVTFGIVEHAGDKENVYPTVLSNDEELRGYIAMLDGKPVFKGVQAEWTNWSQCFSPEALGGLDYVLTDTMTYPDKNGKRMKLWEQEPEMLSPERFMDEYVDWYVRILEEQPIDLLANVSWLPKSISDGYDALWTEARVRRVVETAVRQGVAIEISSGFQLPKLPFLRIAKEAGVKFAFGTNGRYPRMGELLYSREMAASLGLKPENYFVPSPEGPRAARGKGRA